LTLTGWTANDSRMSTVSFGDIGLTLDGTEEYKTILTFFVPSEDPYFRPNMVITRDQLRRPETLESFVNRQKQLISRSPGFGKFKIVEELPLKVGNLSGFKMVYSLTPLPPAQPPQRAAAGQAPPTSATPPPTKEMKPIRQMQIFFIQGPLAYSITASASEESFPQYSPHFERIVQSFKVTS